MVFASIEAFLSVVTTNTSPFIYTDSLLSAIIDSFICVISADIDFFLLSIVNEISLLVTTYGSLFITINDFLSTIFTYVRAF